MIDSQIHKHAIVFDSFSATIVEISGCRAGPLIESFEQSPHRPHLISTQERCCLLPWSKRYTHAPISAHLPFSRRRHADENIGNWIELLVQPCSCALFSWCLEQLLERENWNSCGEIVCECFIISSEHYVVVVGTVDGQVTCI